MDKFSGYVIASYVVTFVVLFSYLGWLWWRLRQEQAAQAQSVQMPSTRAVQERQEQGRR
ncbi:hypothetical protein [Deinococcus sp. UYEF24]